MHRAFHRFFLAIFLVLSSAVSLLALNVPKRPEGYVSDYAKLLSDPARSRLEQILKEFEDKTSNQVLVAVFPGLEGDALESYSIRLAEAWKPGQKGKDNGAILVVFKEDRKVRIEVGYGLEGVLTDALCKLIIQNEIVPRFRAGDYEGGIKHAVAAILSAVQGEYQAPSQPKSEGWRSFEPFLFLSVVISTILPQVVLWVLFCAGIFGVAVSIFIANPILGFGAFICGIMPLIFRFLFPVVFSNSAGFDAGGYYRGYGGRGGFGGFGGGFGGGGGGFGGGGASGSW